jgi:hypothetical protein
MSESSYTIYPYHVEAYIDQCIDRHDGCGWNAKRFVMQLNSSYPVSRTTLEDILFTCEGSVADRVEEFENWYLLAGQYLEDPDRIPF